YDRARARTGVERPTESSFETRSGDFGICQDDPRTTPGPFARVVPRGPRTLHLRGPNSEEERLFSQPRPDDVRVRVRLRDELHVDGVRTSKDHVPPIFVHRP